MNDLISSHYEELYHHGVKGQKWGVRRYQKKDGSLTPAGRKRYSDSTSVKESDVKEAKKEMKAAKKAYNKSFNKAYDRAAAAYSPFKKHREANDARWEDAAEKAEAYVNAKKNYKMMKKSYNETVKSESKKILAGESFIGKTYDVVTGAHKIEAELKINNR